MKTTKKTTHYISFGFSVLGYIQDILNYKLKFMVPTRFPILIIFYIFIV